MIFKKRYLLFVISIALITAIIWYANPILLVNVLSKANISFVFLALGITLISLSLRVLKWKVLLNGVGFMELYPIQVLGMTISNFTPGKVAEPVKAIILKMRKNIDVSASMPSIIWERIMDIIVIVILSIIAINLLSVNSKFFIAGFAGIAIFSAIIIISLVVLYSRKFGMKIFGLTRRLPILKKLPENFMELFYKVQIKKTSLLKCFVLTIIPWSIEGLTFYFVFLSLGVSLNPIILAGIVALSVMIGVVSSLPGGLGTTEVVMILLLGVSGVESTTAIAGVMLFRFVSFWFGAFLGGLSFVYLSKKIDLKNII